MPSLISFHRDCYALEMEQGRIPNSLKKFRRLQGLSQTEVALILGLQKTGSISRWEKGISFPGTEYLFRLSILYKTLPNNFYFELWQKLKQETTEKEQKLLAQHESLISNELYFL